MGYTHVLVPDIKVWSGAGNEKDRVVGNVKEVQDTASPSYHCRIHIGGHIFDASLLEETKICVKKINKN